MVRNAIDGVGNKHNCQLACFICGHRRAAAATYFSCGLGNDDPNNVGTTFALEKRNTRKGTEEGKEEQKTAKNDDHCIICFLCSWRRAG